MHRSFLHRILLALLIVSLVSLPAFSQRDTPEFDPPFFAFQNGCAFGSPEQEAATLKELGYDGISQIQSAGEKLNARIAAYDAVGLKVLSVYLNVDDKPLAEDMVKPLANRGAIIELTVRRMTPETVAAVRQTAEMAAKLNIKVALYPHHGFAVATMPQALDLIAKADHENLGVMFNLCHFLKNEDANDLPEILAKAKPHLFAVSTCGANVNGTGWGELIQPLDRGDFPQAKLFETLKELEFAGPVGLQCFAVPGDKKQNLKRSIDAWREIIADVN